MLVSLTDTFNFVEEISFPCSCNTDSDNLTTGQTLLVLVYVATMNADQLQAILKDFIWRGKKVQIRHSIGEYADGDLRDLNIPSNRTSAKISWIGRLFDSFHS